MRFAGFLSTFFGLQKAPTFQTPWLVVFFGRFWWLLYLGQTHLLSSLNLKALEKHEICNGLGFVSDGFGVSLFALLR